MSLSDSNTTNQLAVDASLVGTAPDGTINWLEDPDLIITPPPSDGPLPMMAAGESETITVTIRFDADGFSGPYDNAAEVTAEDALGRALIA